MDLLYNRVRKGERVDRLWWKLAPQEIFDVRSYHKVTIPFPIVVSLEDSMEFPKWLQRLISLCGWRRWVEF